MYIPVELFLKESEVSYDGSKKEEKTMEPVPAGNSIPDIPDCSDTDPGAVAETGIRAGKGLRMAVLYV